ncbi:hypothetical protein B4915_11670 [Leucobacter massiliensis]|uniref:Excisionase n=1 Tax=Leucobacter massiliensis TaxID=1686285 RepID=A0A2S9QLN5_9MICO|nr:hypothetical protein B4915_11670 [Leucobacter massiliensis]
MGRSGVSRGVIVLAVTGTILLALGAFWLSFTTLQDLAVLSGVPAGQAWVWPLIVDGVILEATISVVALRNSAPAARRFAWLLLASGAGVSVAANITHAVVASDTRVPAIIAALVASVPPLVLLAMTHLTVELTRNEAPQRTSETPTVNRRRAASTPVLSAARSSSNAGAGPSAPAFARAKKKGSAGREQAVALASHGVSRRQIATELGVHPTTVGRWLSAPDRRENGASHD